MYLFENFRSDILIHPQRHFDTLQRHFDTLQRHFDTGRLLQALKIKGLQAIKKCQCIKDSQRVCIAQPAPLDAGRPLVYYGTGSGATNTFKE